MNGVDLRALLKRLEELEGPDRDVDIALDGLVFSILPHGSGAEKILSNTPYYTHSIDAAVGLVSKLLPDWGGKIMWNGGDIAKGGYVEMDLPNPRWKDPDCPAEEMNRYAGLVSSYDDDRSKPHDPKPFAIALLVAMAHALIAKAEAEEGVGEF